MNQSQKQKPSQPQASCPTFDQLLSLLDDTRQFNESVANHVDGCDSCQRQLDQLTDSKGLSGYRDHANHDQMIQRQLGPPHQPGDLGSLQDLAIESRIGAGGMGVVYRGRDVRLGRKVAVKILARGTSLQSDARFLRETKAAAKLNHNHLVPVYSAGRVADGTPYLVMPLIEGISLRERIDQGPIPVQEVVRIVQQVASGLQAVHDANLIHRDVKPANILLDRDEGRAKLTDFGLAYDESDASLTRADIITGTPEYMSPEQIDDAKSHDIRGDIYSLGMTLYASLTGSPPFGGQPLHVLQQQRESEPVRPSILNTSIPRDVENICLMAIAKSPERRYQTAQAFEQDLNNFLNGRPVVARETTTLQRLTMWCGRNQALAASLFLLGLSLIAGTIISTSMWMKSRHNEQVASHRAEQLAIQTGQLRGAVDTFFARVVGDQSAGMQMSAGFRNRMVGDMIAYYDSMVKQNPDDIQLALDICEKALEVSIPMENLQLVGPVTNLFGWTWSVIKPFAVEPNAGPRELIIASRTALSLIPKASYVPGESIFQFVTDETRDQKALIEYAERFAQRAIANEATADARICKVMASVMRLQFGESSSAEERKAGLNQCVVQLDQLGDEFPEQIELYHYRAKTRRWIGALSAPLEAADFRAQGIELYQKQLKELESAGEITIWARRDIAVNRVFCGIELFRANQFDKAIASIDEGIAEFDQMLDENPTFIVLIADLAESEWMKTQISWSKGQIGSLGNDAGFERSIFLFRKLLDIDRNQPHNQRQLAEIQFIAGAHFKTHNQFDRAKELFEAAVEDCKPMLELEDVYQFPGMHKWLDKLHSDIATEMDDMGFHKRAKEIRGELL